MTKVDNDGQVVKKEIFKITIGDTFPLYMLDYLSVEARVIVLGLGCYCTSLEYAQKWNDNKKFDFFCVEKINYFFAINIDDIYAAIQELEEKGYLFRDEDGNLVFTQGEAV